MVRDGDSGFVGVDMRNSPWLVNQGFVSHAKNMRFRNGRAETRKGLYPVRWGAINHNLIDAVDADTVGKYFHASTTDEQKETLIQATSDIQSMGECIGVARFNDPDDRRYTILAVRHDLKEKASRSFVTKFYALREGAIPEEIPTTTRVSASKVEFTQCFNGLVLHHGLDKAPLVMTDIVEGFKALDAPTGGTIAMPGSTTGLFFGNRLWVPIKNSATGKVDTVVASDLLSYNQYDFPTNEFSINQGEDDEIIGLAKFNDFSILVFKRRNIYVISNAYGDLSNLRVDRISGSYGLLAPRAFQAIGSDIWFLNETGVVSLKRTDFSSIQATTIPVSEPIEPLINRINWKVAKESAATGYWDNKFYLSVPIDGATSNNAVLVYDFQTQSWQGYDQVDNISVSHFFVTETESYNRLHYFSFDKDYYSVNNESETTYESIGFGHVGVYEYGMYDYAPVTTSYSVIVEVTEDMDSMTGTKAFKFKSDGTTINAASGLSVNTGTIWGTKGEQAIAITNLQSGASGYTWAIDGYTFENISNGVIFHSSAPFEFDPQELYYDEDDPDRAPWVTVGHYLWADLNEAEIPFEVKTRGYNWKGGEIQRPLRFRVFVDTWDAEYSVKAYGGGVGEEQTVVSATRPDRTKFFTAGRPTWDSTNTNNDFSNKRREDYSLVLNASGTELHSGLILNQFQSQSHGLQVPFTRGTHAQFQIEGTGQVRLGSVLTDSVGDIKNNSIHR
tara:strand:- start:2716 stop:4905 length:2190 start_codon:yes stop_codon:yes gene_type:complete